MLEENLKVNHKQIENENQKTKTNTYLIIIITNHIIYSHILSGKRHNAHYHRACAG